MKSWINEVNKTADRDKSGRGSTPKAKTPKRPFISLQRQDLKPVSQFWMCTRSIWKIPETTLPSSISHQLLIKPNFYRRAQISTVFKAIHTISTRISRGLRTTSSNKKSYIVPGASLGSHAGSPISQQKASLLYGTWHTGAHAGLPLGAHGNHLNSLHPTDCGMRWHGRGPNWMPTTQRSMRIKSSPSLHILRVNDLLLIGEQE